MSEPENVMEPEYSEEPEMVKKEKAKALYASEIIQQLISSSVERQTQAETGLVENEDKSSNSTHFNPMNMRK